MRVRAAAAFLALVAARAAAEAPVPERGPLLAVRAGYGVPSGDVMRGGPAVSAVVERKFPIGFELGYRLTRRFWAQLGFEFAPAEAGAAACPGGPCTASNVRVGAKLVVRLLPGARVDPWLAAGAGVEVLSATGGARGGTPGHTERTWAGIDFPYLEAGAEVALSRWVGVGPWASISFARYTSDSVKAEGRDEVSGAVQGRATHRWISAGLMATLRL